MPNNMIFLAVHLFLSKRKLVSTLYATKTSFLPPLEPSVRELAARHVRPASSLLLLSLGNSDARHRLNFRKAHAGRGLDDAEDASTVGTLEVSRLRFGSRSIHGLRSRARDPAATGSTESTVRLLSWRPLAVPDAFAYARSWCALFRALMCLLPCAARG